MAENESDSKFYREFAGGMRAIHLPPPSEFAFGSLTMAVASLKGMADIVGKLGPKTSVRELILAFPLAGAPALVATATGEVLGVAAAGLASLYLGACAGAALAAAVDVYGTEGVVLLTQAIGYVVARLGTSLEEILKNAKCPNMMHFNARIIPMVRFSGASVARAGGTARRGR
jgi:hypothetical protein